MSDPSIMNVSRKIVELFSDRLTPLKLQKLAYYCQAWSLVWREAPLFPEEFQAWANGPVNPALFQKHKGTYVVNDGFLNEYSDYKFDDDQMRVIKSIIKFYGSKEPFYLSELTHKELPWRKARNNTPPGEKSTAIISIDDMAEYYTGISTT